MERLKVTMPVDNTVMTKQAPAEQQSVSALLKQYVNLGMVPANGPVPSYGDFTGLGDFHECLGRVMEARDQFQRLPARVRRVAENDPGMFLEMVFGQEAELMAELVAAGLLEAHVPVAAKPVEEPVQPVPQPA